MNKKGLKKYFKKFLSKITLLVVSFLLMSVFWVVIYIWINPTFSPLMLKRKTQVFLESGWSKSEIHYSWVNLDKISSNMALAVISSEDQNFKEHFGFDVKAIEKALNYNKKHRKTRGASTISQQVAKNAFLWEGRSWLRKGFEVYFTLLIETFWTKERILEVYLNIAEMGDKVFGVQETSVLFFKIQPKRLSMDQAALIAAVLPNPIKFKINKPSSYVIKRKNWIRRQMNNLGKEYMEELRINF